jgi:hypothetical protein
VPEGRLAAGEAEEGCGGCGVTDFDKLVRQLVAERHRPAPKPAWLVDTPEVCAARLRALEEAVRGFVFTPAAVRRKQKLRAHQNRKARGRR